MNHHPAELSGKEADMLKSYVLGFGLSLLLTLSAFYAVYAGFSYALPFIVFCAVLQIIVQLVYFLHIGSKHTERSYGMTLLLAFSLIAILVGGTLWIMQNLERHHMMSPTIDDLYEGGMVAPQNEIK